MSPEIEIMKKKKCPDIFLSFLFYNNKEKCHGPGYETSPGVPLDYQINITTTVCSMMDEKHGLKLFSTFSHRVDQAKIPVRLTYKFQHNNMYDIYTTNVPISNITP